MISVGSYQPDSAADYAGEVGSWIITLVDRRKFFVKNSQCSLWTIKRHSA
jgi:hypothetical protein